MKTKIFTLFVVLLATTNLWAYAFEVDGIYYNITSENTAKVTYKSRVDKGLPRWNEDWNIDVVIIPATVTYNSNIYNVTSIGENAFRECKSLISATLPNSITTIHNGAFSDCINLKSINIPDGVKTIGSNENTSGTHTSGAFYNCCSLVDITIPNSIVSIEGLAFADCTGLTTITIPNSVTTIYESAFRDVPNVMYSGMAEGYPWGARSVNGYIEGWLVYKDASKSQLLACSSAATDEINLPNTVTSIGDEAFSYCSSLTSITIPNSVTSIGDYAFFECSSIFTITIPNSVTSIGYGAFLYIPNIVYHGTAEGAPWGAQYHNAYVEGWLLYSDASKNHILKCSYRAYGEIEIPNSVTTIEDYAFEDCSSLTSITIPNSVTSIGEEAFYNCSSLTSVTIPNSVTSIGEGAFMDCSKLTSVTIGESVTTIGDGAFMDCSKLTSVTIPNSVTSIGNMAFSGCSGLTSVTIGESVTSIGDEAFSDCTSLTSITIPNSVTSIGGWAFSSCSSLTSITIPNSVTSIGDGAFMDCEKLGTVILGDKVKEIGEEAFNGCNKLYHIYCYAPEPPMAYESSFANYNVNLYVPCNYLDNYKYDRVFGSFRYIECIDSEDATTDGNVTVDPGFNDVTITWPTDEKADCYSLVINKDGEPFCTLTFNADGQLLNIAFAPGRDGNHPVQYAEQAVNGYRFTVTGLTEATQYAYNITTKDAANNTIATYSGEFTTKSNMQSGVSDIQSPSTNCKKIIRNGQLLILRDGKTYTIMGQVMKEK
ncbi:MAG: leucine-rich repeat domain-containing protein [Paludibacteraceae bacterium]|nr:leucine-rich repeat domain-containing protein [Paludibacteraceae bacterium]